MIRRSAQIQPGRERDAVPRSCSRALPAVLTALAVLCAGCSTDPGPGTAGMPNPSAGSPAHLPTVPPGRPSSAPAEGDPVATSRPPLPPPGRPEDGPAVTGPPGRAPSCPGDARVAEAVWVERSDGPALRVRPHEDLRGCGGPLTVAADPPPGWSDLVRQVPDADSPGMREQYDCHLRLAPGQEVWHLEPWRPVVTDAQMLGSLCNPGAPDPELQGP